jgi:predicted PurR-regulated permease PerM
MAGLFNFVPFIGGLVSFGVIALVALASFDSLLAMSLPPAAYLVIHILEGQIITPLIMSRRLLLSPIAIVLSLIFWAWMWGIPGTLLAVPILAAFKIIAEHVDGLNGIAMLLTRRAPQLNSNSSSERPVT